MKYIADLHIHSHFSRATSKMLTPEHLDYYAGIKGIKVVGTGDFTHPGWLAELKEKTEPDGNGLFKLKKGYKLESQLADNGTRFLLTAEISNIYKRGGKVRKVHNVVLVPGFGEAEKINQKLINLGGNLTSDGRPILGLDSRDLLEIVLECGNDNYFIPAHIWTPWFSMLGSKSGFDSLEECFADLSPHIHTIETGLSTDPPMNWLCSFLDNVTLVSNSDAHSPDRLGRNANIFDTGLDYFSLTKALKTGDPEKYLGTIDMFPQEGKYHYDGHRKCDVCWNPVETLKYNGICPSCKKPITIGVMNRIIQLSDREDISERPNKLPFRSIIPLPEILSEINGVGVKSKKIAGEYSQIIQKLGNELGILLDTPIEEIEKKSSKTLAEAIRRMRNREIIIKEGYDGEYGIINVFKPGEAKNFEAGNSLFQFSQPAPPPKRALIDFDLKGTQELIRQKTDIENLVAEKAGTYETKATDDPTFDGLNPEQLAAVKHVKGPSLIIAGPGTGKTKTITSKIAWLIGNHHAQANEILAITFTNKAAGELKERIGKILANKNQAGEITVSTFHAFGLSVLKKYHKEFKRDENFILVDENLKKEIIKSISNEKASEAKKLSEEITSVKKGSIQETPFFIQYENELEKMNAFDLDDLIEKPVRLLSEQTGIAEETREKYRFVFVDEYQDTNETQYKLLRLLAHSPSSNLCVVGDANQSIYGFRGANPAYISKFTEDYPDAKTFRLTKSYRCPQTILTASSNVIGQQQGFLEGLSEGVQISISEQPSGAAEAEFIARQIVSLVGGVSFFSIDSSVAQGDKNESIGSLSDLAILCRTRNQFETIAKALNDHNVPFQKIGTVPFFQQENFQVFTDMLGAFLSGSFEQASQIFKLRKKTISKLQYELAQTEMKKPGTVPFLNYIKENYFKTDEIKPDEWERFVGLAEGEKSIAGFLQILKLGFGADDLDKKMEAVSLMTLHASKGLEFECVFIPGCEKGLLPYNLYKQEVDENEEKRLLYVGMTRAKKLLYLTYAKTRAVRGRKLNLHKSPFLDSIQQELLQQIKNKPHKKQGAQSQQLSLF